MGRLVGVAAFAAVLSLTGCSSYTTAEQDYLEMSQQLGWVMDSEAEEREALQFAYDVCDQLRSGASIFQLNDAYVAGSPKSEAVTSARVYLCPELR